MSGNIRTVWASSRSAWLRRAAWLLERARADGGQAVVLGAAMMAALCGVGALTVDVGLLVHERVTVRNAVEAGALAGAQQLPNNAASADTIARQYVLDNAPELNPANLSVSFRCVVGDRNHDGLPDLGDIPMACDPGGNASWTTGGGISASLCIPAEGDKCNVIVVSASNTVDFSFARTMGIDTGTTGTITSAACRGVCGGPPTGPVDLVLIIDRTGSMSAADITNARSAAGAILGLYDPSLQWVALGLLGPSQTGTSCSGANSPAKAKGASAAQYATANWIPVGLTGIGAPVNQAYAHADHTLDTSSTIVKAINCFDTSSTGTNLSTPVLQAKNYLLANGRPNAKKGIIIETDGSPNYSGAGNAADYTCAAANTQAQAAKTAGIEVFTIGFGVGASDLCPDSTGFYHNRSVTRLLADMATSSTDDGCTAAENTDGDHFFCAPKTSQLASIFQSAAATLAGGARLIALP